MNKPVNCGCGGKSDIHFIGNTYIGEYHKFIGKYFICCEECGIKTSIYNSKKEAIEAWNKAMGVRTAMVIKGSDGMITVAACENCCTVVSIFDKYCPSCGTRLEWSEE